MRVLMLGRSPSIALEDLRKYWGEVDVATPPIIPKKRYDLVVAQEPTPRIGVPAYLLAKAMGAKLVVEVHGDYLAYLSASRRIIAMLILRKADYVRAVNHTIARKLRSMGVGNILVIPSIYVNVKLFKPTQPHNRRPKTIIYAGRFTAEKNLPLILQTFAQTLKEEQDSSLLLVGKGSKKQEVLALAERMRVRKRMKIISWVPQHKLPILYNNSSIFLLTSRYEGGPRAVFEAGACWTPFVSTRVGILAETAQHGVHGFFAEPEVEDLAEKILNLLENPQKRQMMGEAMRKLVLDKFEWSKATRKYAEAYLSLLK